MSTWQDLNTPDAIREFIRRFYDKVLADDQLGPIFLDVAAIDIEEHREILEAFWRKLLLGEKAYDRHMMDIHRAVHKRHGFSEDNFRRWLQYFEATLDEGYRGDYAHRARFLARSIATNLQEALLTPTTFSQRTRPIERPPHT